MRLASAAIIALAGSVILAAGISGSGDQYTFALLTGVVVGLIGMAAWAKKFIEPTKE